jgi:hypothetical protein
MRSQLIVLALTFAVAYSAVLPKEVVNVAANAKWANAIGVLEKASGPVSLATVGENGFSYAVDTVAAITQANFNCIYSYGYKLAFLRLYGPNNNGQGDATGINNIYYATNAGLSYEVFVTPSTTNVKSASTQFTEAYNYANSQGLKLSRVWLQVTSPINWGGNTYTNTQFINSFISTASSYGLSVGIYSNWYDWQQITGSATTISPTPYALWYWSANGVGKNGETATNVNDFVKFGPFSSAMVKQYGIAETLCSNTLNLNIFASSTNLKPNTVDASMRKAVKET